MIPQAKLNSLVHDSSEVIEEIEHLLDEVHQVCKVNGIPYALIVEEKFTPTGEATTHHNGFIPDSRSEYVPAAIWITRAMSETPGLDNEIYELLKKAGRIK